MQPEELPHGRGPISWKNDCPLLCLVSSPLEVPGVLLGIICNHTPSAEPCESDFSVMKRSETPGKRGVETERL